MNALDKLPATVMGDRLRQSREVAQITQAEAALHLGVARTTIVAIEKGERRIRSDELALLAQLYSDTVSRILRPRNAPQGLVLQYRKGLRSKDALPNSSRTGQIMEELVDYAIEVEELLQFHAPGVIPQEHAIIKAQLDAQAEDLALRTRQNLGVGVGGVFLNLIRSLESEYLLHVFVHPLPSEICGAFAFDPEFGGCILLNRLHAPVRQLRTLCHELGHYLTSQNHADIVVEGEKESGIEERFANKFADGLLMPAPEVRRQFNSLAELKGTFTLTELGELSEHFRVSIETITRRLEELRLLPPATFEAQVHPRLSKVNRKSPNNAAQEVLGRTRFERQIAEAVAREVLSEGRAAEMLSCDRTRVRAMIDEAVGAADNAQLI